MIYSDLKDREAYRLLFPNYPDVLDVPQLCEILSIGVKTAYKLLRNGEIAHLRVGRAYRIPKCHVIAYLQKCGMPEKAVKKYKLIPYNPAADVTRPKIDNFVSNYYDAQQLAIMLDAFKGSSIELPVTLTAFYGFRRSEVLGLKWSAIDFKNNTLTVSHTVSRAKIDGKTQLILKNRTKNKSSFRSLPLIPQVKQMLLQAREKQKRNQKVCKSQYNTQFLEYICVDDIGNLLYPDRVSRGFCEKIKKLDLPYIRFHDLRHSCASLLLANGISLKEIQLWLGHSNFATTANIYAHLDMSSKQASAATIAGCLSLNPSISPE